MVGLDFKLAVGISAARDLEENLLAQFSEDHFRQHENYCEDAGNVFAFSQSLASRR